MSVDTLLTKYKLAARAQGLSEKTIDHVELSVGFFDGFLGGVPAPKIPKTLPKILTEGELIAVFEAPKNLRDKVILEAFLDSGMRLRELADLNKDDADAESVSGIIVRMSVWRN